MIYKEISLLLKSSKNSTSVSFKQYKGKSLASRDDKKNLNLPDFRNRSPSNS